MRAFSSGGGVQSIAALVLQAQGKTSYDVHLFSNVGADSESPDTLDYVHNIAIPYAEQHGIKFVELFRETNNRETLLQRTLRETKSIHIPVRMKNGAPGTRDCTNVYKRQVIRNYLGKGDHVVGLGISWEEIWRMRTDSGYKNITNEYPLIDMKLTRVDCAKIIKDAGLPVPPKSSCWFCPFQKLSEWANKRQNKPGLFLKSVELEIILNNKRAAMGKDQVFLSSRGKPLDQAICDQPSLLEQEDTCESGYCMT